MIVILTRTISALLIVAWLSVSMVAAANYYVDAAAGVDTNNGTSSSTPVQNIQKALDIAGAAGGEAVVYVKPGTYTESLGGAAYTYLYIKDIGTHTYTNLSLLACDSSWTPTTDPSGVILATTNADHCIRRNAHSSPGNGLLIRGFTITPAMSSPDGGVFNWAGTGDWNLTIDHCVITPCAEQTTYGLLNSASFTNPTRTLTITNCSGTAPANARMGCYLQDWAAITCTGNTFSGLDSTSTDDEALDIYNYSAPATGSFTLICTNNTWSGGSFVYIGGHSTYCPLYLTMTGNHVNSKGGFGFFYNGHKSAQAGSTFVISDNTFNMLSNGASMVSAIEIGGNSGFNKYPFALTQVLRNTIRVRGTSASSDHGINVQDRCVGAEVAYNDIQPWSTNDGVFEYGLNVLATRAHVHHNISVAAVPLVGYMSKDSHFHHNTLKVGGYLTGTGVAKSAIALVYGPILPENCRFTDNIVDGSLGTWALRIYAADSANLVARTNVTIGATGASGAADTNIVKITDADAGGWVGAVTVASGTAGSAAILAPGTANEIRGIVWAIDGNDLYVMFDYPLSLQLPPSGTTGQTVHIRGPSHVGMTTGYANNCFDRNLYVAGASGLASIPTGTGATTATCADLAALHTAWATWGVAVNDTESIEDTPYFHNASGTFPWNLNIAMRSPARGAVTEFRVPKGAWCPKTRMINRL